MGNGIIDPNYVDGMLEPGQGDFTVCILVAAPRSRKRTKGRRSAEKTVGDKPLFGNSMDFTEQAEKTVGRARELL